MNIFGCKFYYETTDGKKEFDRKNFDSLLWALVTVFQVHFTLFIQNPDLSSAFLNQ